MVSSAARNLEYQIRWWAHEKADNSVVVADTINCRRENWHHVQPSAFSDEYGMNMYLSIFLSFFNVPTVSYRHPLYASFELSLPDITLSTLKMLQVPYLALKKAIIHISLS